MQNHKYILGLNLYHANSSACLFYGNNLIAAAEEERFVRIKNFSGFPINAIKFCINKANIKLDHLEYICINQNKKSNFFKKLFYILSQRPKINYLIDKAKIKFQRENVVFKFNNLLNEHGVFNGKIVSVEHHISHLFSSFYYSDFDESVSLSVDGFGDFCSTAWGASKKSDITSIDKKIFFPHSLGIFYQALTQYLGFKNYGDEYKVMGLSAFGLPKYCDKLGKIVYPFGQGEFRLNLDFFNHHTNNVNFQFGDGLPKFSDLYTQNLINLLGKPRDPDEPIQQKHMDLAASVQKTYEDCFFYILRHLNQKYSSKNLCLSGGCAMNSLANGKILSNTGFKKLYIPPNPGDGGGALGAATYQVLKNFNFKLKLNENNIAYTGPNYDNDFIELEIKKNNLENFFIVKNMEYKEMNCYLAKKLMELKLIGWFQDSMEWGPRALGNRSIIASPVDIKIKEIINLKIKKRESFRPFAPSVLEEEANIWFDIPDKDPFMTEVYPVKRDLAHFIPAVVNIDNTGRLQTVSKKNNFKFYNLIKEFHKLSSVPMLLNTSFNENEPIVCSPKEAIDCFVRTKIDILVMQNWVISRE